MSIIEFEGMSPKLGEDVFVADNATLIGDLEIGKDSSFWFNVVARADVHKIRIGERTNIQDGSIIHVTHFTETDQSDGHPTIIGNDVTVGHMVLMHGCTIEDFCLIGMGAKLIDGCVIGKESMVGAGALVTQNKAFPPRSLILGSPAKVVRELTDAEVAHLHKSAQNYVGYKNRYLKA